MFSPSIGPAGQKVFVRAIILGGLTCYWNSITIRNTLVSPDLLWDLLSLCSRCHELLRHVLRKRPSVRSILAVRKSGSQYCFDGKVQFGLKLLKEKQQFLKTMSLHAGNGKTTISCALNS